MSAKRRCAISKSRSTIFIVDVPVERRPGDTKRRAEGRHAVPLGGVESLELLHLLGRELVGRPSLASSSPGGCQAGTRPLTDEPPLELRQRSEDVEDQLAATRGGVDLLLQGPEPHVTLRERCDGFDQVAQGAAQAVKSPDDEGVTGAEV
jgi:hypothetical protein